MLLAGRYETCVLMVEGVSSRSREQISDAYCSGPCDLEHVEGLALYM